MSQPNYEAAIETARKSRHTNETFSDDQLLCLFVLGVFAQGFHHLPPVKREGAYAISIQWRGDLSTFDYDGLTRLVLLAHQWSVRVSIKQGGPGSVKVFVSRRQPCDDDSKSLFERHPTLDGLINRIQTLKGHGE